MSNPIDQIIAYENGELDEDETVSLFQDLVNSGLAWSLQGHYGRTATYMLDTGIISPPSGQDACPIDPAWTREHRL